MDIDRRRAAGMPRWFKGLLWAGAVAVVAIAAHLALGGGPGHHGAM